MAGWTVLGADVCIPRKALDVERLNLPWIFRG